MASLETGGIVVATTQYLERDEPALLLIEENRFADDLRTEYRWQLVYVGRGNRIYEFPRNLGPSSKFQDVEGFLIFSGGEDSVAVLLDMAEEQRGENKLKALLQERAASSTFKEDAIRMVEQKHELVKRNLRTLRNQYGLSYERKIYRGY